jgi:multisubunit Na+/H+ antiporter MnhC subunit
MKLIEYILICLVLNIIFVIGIYFFYGKNKLIPKKTKIGLYLMGCPIMIPLMGISYFLSEILDYLDEILTQLQIK